MSKPASCKRPSFFIAGAPKCGTTSLHFALNQHPGIYLPDDEVHHYSMDDPVWHRGYFHTRGGALNGVWLGEADQQVDAWYRQKYADAPDGAICGEDSPVYLYSPVAAHRIRQSVPDAKAIFMLRDPVKRAYSQYWHLMKMGRATQSFEDTLLSNPLLISGSTYELHLRHWIDVLGHDRVKIVLFEDYMADQGKVLDEVLAFIGAPAMDLSKVDGWANRTTYPSNPGLKRFVNRLAQPLVQLRYRDHASAELGLAGKVRSKLYYYWFHKLNPLLLKADKPPAMKAETQAYLARHFKARNQGLEALLGRDLAEVWPSFRASD